MSGSPPIGADDSFFSQSRGGYRQEGWLLPHMFNAVTAALLLMASFPFLVIVPLLILVMDGRPILYRGVRMGMNKQPFHMYKFRTLVVDAEKRLGERLLSAGDRLTTRSGKLLRETRLDELPQLINVLRGEMALVGPRPERPEVYERVCRFIPGYDVRFAVRPGVIGYSQLFTPHSAPKRARTLIDNHYVKRRQRPFSDIVFFMQALAWIAARAAVKVKGAARRWFDCALGRGPCTDLRASERLHFEATVQIRAHAGDPWLDARLVDISDEGIAFISPLDQTEGAAVELWLHVEREVPARKGIKRKQARCAGTLLRREPLGGEYRYVAQYTPLRDIDRLVLHTYFLRKSIV